MRTISRLLTAAIVGLAQPAIAKDLRIGLAAEPSSMDPHFHNLTPNNGLLSHIFERLVDNDAKNQLMPSLAESWKAIDDRNWQFKLRKGVKWHDGSPFTADDVIFAFDRAATVPNSPSSFAPMVRGKTVKKVDDFTVEITTPAPFPLMPNDLSNLLIVSKQHGLGASTSDYNSGKVAIGTGPYKFSSFVPGDRIELIRNDDHLGPKAKWDKIILKSIKEGSARISALLAGDVDVIEDVPTTDIEGLKKDARVNISQVVSRRVIYFHMDQFREETPFIKAKDGSAIKNPLRDRRVRLAISKAINREAIVSRVMEGVAIPAGQFLADGFFGISPNLKPEAFDLDGSKKLLAEAGFPHGFRLTLHAPSGRFTNDARIAEAVAQMLTRAGIDTQLETLPPSVFFTRASSGANGLPEFSFILVGWGSDTGETSSPLRALVGTFDPTVGSGSANRGRYSNPVLDNLINEALTTVDDTKRASILATATEIAMKDVAIIPTHYQINTWAARAGLRVDARTDEYTLANGVIEE